jgi:hypothetical protein
MRAKSERLAAPQVLAEKFPSPAHNEIGMLNINLAQAVDKQVNTLRFVTGHDLSRAANATKQNTGL